MAEILFEAIGSKNQQDELLDFHTRFDREISQNATNPKIIDIHSITKESKNNYPELIKDLLDRIPFYEPFDGNCPNEGSRGKWYLSYFLCDYFKGVMKISKAVLKCAYRMLCLLDSSTSRCGSFVPIPSDNAIDLGVELSPPRQVKEFLESAFIFNIYTWL